jgi:hypothetical protein
LSFSSADFSARDRFATCGQQVAFPQALPAPSPRTPIGIGFDDHSRMTIKIVPNDKGNPPDKLAEVELHFADGPLAGLKLVGFSIWQRRGGGSGRNVTFPARSYAVNGERRSFALLRPVTDVTAQDKLREVILEAYAEYEERAAVAS